MTTQYREYRAQRLNPFAILRDACVNAVRRCWWMVPVVLPLLVLFNFVNSYVTESVPQPDSTDLISYQLKFMLMPLWRIPIDSLAAAIPFLWAIRRITLTDDERRLTGMVAVARLCSIWFQTALLFVLLSLLTSPTGMMIGYAYMLGVTAEFLDLVMFVLYLPVLVWMGSVFAATCPIMVMERCHLWTAMKRSAKLSRGYRLRIAVCLLILWIFLVVINRSGTALIFGTELGWVFEQYIFYIKLLSALIVSVSKIFEGAVMAMIFVRLSGVEKADERQISVFD